MNLDVNLDAWQLVDSFLGGQYLERDATSPCQPARGAARAPFHGRPCGSPRLPSAPGRLVLPAFISGLAASAAAGAIAGTQRQAAAAMAGGGRRRQAAAGGGRRRQAAAGGKQPGHASCSALGSACSQCMRMRREEGRWPKLAEQHAFFAC